MNFKLPTVLLVIVLPVILVIYLSVRKLFSNLQTFYKKELEVKEADLDRLNKEKADLLVDREWLMKEIHHRVKNNLQIVISLLNTQLAYLKQGNAFDAVKESQHRMQSISMVHQKLYQSENLAGVGMKPYITDLVSYLSDNIDNKERIAFKLEIFDVDFDAATAVPIGLILNEAITNSLKYGFPNAKENGLITIKLLNYEGIRYELYIGDNGVGDKTIEEFAEAKSLGMSLIRGLSKQIKGVLKIENTNGFVVSIIFNHEHIDRNVYNFKN